MADDAQKRFAENPTDETRRNRDQAERMLVADRARVDQANAAIDRKRSEAGANDPFIAMMDDVIADARDRQQSLAESARIDGAEADPKEMERLRKIEIDAMIAREERMRGLSAAEQAHLDVIQQETAARQRSVEEMLKQAEFEQGLRDKDNPLGDASRGRDLAMTPAERSAEKARQGVADIFAYFGRLAEATTGLVDRTAMTEAVNGFADEERRQAAPGIAALADSVMNAVIQGPSRAALNVSDISTQQGAAELNRLLRGEDSSRDQNVVELQRQSKILEEVNKSIKDATARLGVA